MTKINLVDEVLKHTDEEVIEYLYGLVAGIRRQYNNVEDPMWLLASCGEVEQVYSVLKGLKERNDRLNNNNSL